MPGKLDQLRLEQLQRLDVEIVGRLVEHEHVGRPREQPREQQPVALAARQRLHRRSRALGRKQKVFEIAVHVARTPPTVTVSLPSADGVDDRALGIELLALLIEVRDLHVRAAPDLARVGLELADQQPQQRRLAGAVRPDQADPIAAQDPRREIAGRPARRRSALLTSSASKTIWPVRSARSIVQAHARSARGARRVPRASPSSARTRPSSRVRRAFTPRRSQTSSCASFLSNFACGQRFVREPRLLLARNVA